MGTKPMEDLKHVLMGIFINVRHLAHAINDLGTDLVQSINGYKSILAYRDGCASSTSILLKKLVNISCALRLPYRL